jgi:formylglycine-generating enzyme required for sulfatase activity
MHIELVEIPAGTFFMGSASAEASEYEQPVHEVRVEDFWLGVNPVTQGQWEAVMGDNPAHFRRGPDYPVECVDLIDIDMFLEKLRARTKRAYRLPTEREWEYACRAGSAGDRYGDLDAVAWHSGNAGETTHPVGQKLPNAFELCDMLGNVYEWCADWFWQYPAIEPFNPWGRYDNDPEYAKVIRGGCFRAGAWAARAPWRYWQDPAERSMDVGFRLALDR